MLAKMVAIRYDTLLIRKIEHVLSRIEEWRVDPSASCSDHRYILFNIGVGNLHGKIGVKLL